MPNLRKIIIAGTSGCGKTFLGRALSLKLGIPYKDLDDLYWLPGWIKRNESDFLHLVKSSTCPDAWILCGNNARVREEFWQHADTIIWLDLPLATCLYRAGLRSLKTWADQEEICNGNHETLNRFLGRDSILLWIYKSHARRRKEYNQYFAEHHDKRRLVRLTSSKEIAQFIRDAH